MHDRDTLQQPVHPPGKPPENPPQRWDVFCRVVDNHGDLGVCWRLSKRLAALGHRVRLWCDDAEALAWMAPAAAAGVSVLPWRGPEASEAPGDVVIEAFGCEPPQAFVERMAARRVAPVWINLEHLSAEAYAERCHGLASPQARGASAGGGLVKWFFYPGFTATGGGLLCEDELGPERAAFDADAWLAALGISPARPALRVSLFGYEQPALAAWLLQWQTQPTLLLVSPGAAAEQAAALLSCHATPGQRVRRRHLTAHFLPWLSQADHDRLLWSCDLNHVRGEDSAVRALWAARPFVWQLYVQQDGAHRAKLEAFLDLYLQGAAPALARALRLRFRGANGMTDTATTTVDRVAWAQHASERSAALRSAACQGGDLAVRLCRFALSKR